MHKLLQQRDEETKKSRYSLNEVVCNNFLQKNIYEILMQFWKVCGVDSQQARDSLETIWPRWL
jgi:hypothetical protein